MLRKTFFFLSSENFHVQTWKNGALSKATYFPNSAEGLQQLADFLQTHHDPSYLLVDLIEEDFRHEVVPHLTGSNFQALIQRKFDQYYRNTPFRIARLQRRQTDGRRDDEMLFSALTNPARITAWLDLLLLHKTPLAGIYSLPHASIPLVKEMDFNNLLLLSWEKDAGLRQSYYFNQRLRFSRLTPLNPSSTFADAVATETARTYQYLQSLSLTPHNEQLQVHIICHAQDKTQLDTRLPANQNMHYAYLDLQQLGKRFKSRETYRSSDATPLFLHLLATRAPHGNYANPAHMHYYRLWQTQRGLFSLAAITAVVCIVWSIFSFIDGNSVGAEVDTYTAQSRRLTEETRHITQGFNSTLQNADGSPVQASDMKASVTAFRKLQNYSPSPQLILKELTATLDDFPRIRTNKLAWQTTDAPGGGYAPAQVITFTGELLDFGTDYRSALNYLERFQLTLTKAKYGVTPLKMPLDFSSQGSISADISEARDKPAEFSLKIIWRPQE